MAWPPGMLNADVYALDFGVQSVTGGHDPLNTLALQFIR